MKKLMIGGFGVRIGVGKIWAEPIIVYTGWQRINCRQATHQDSRISRFLFVIRVVGCLLGKFVCMIWISWEKAVEKKTHACEMK